VIECSPSLFFSEAPWRIVLPNGETVRGNGTSWPFTPTDGSMPANERIRRLDTDGEGVVVTDNAAAIAAALTEHNATVPRPSGAGLAGGFCSVSAGRGDAGWWLVGLAGLALALRRRS
jgi:MYXO-CTERM domain-containing protein